MKSFKEDPLMAVLKPFAAIRPVPNLACRVAALPYDVMNTEEARKMVERNPSKYQQVKKTDWDNPVGFFCLNTAQKLPQND